MNYLQELDLLAHNLYRQIIAHVEKDQYGFPLYPTPDARIIKNCIAQTYGYPRWDEYVQAIRKNNALVNQSHHLPHSDKTFSLYKEIKEYKEIIDCVNEAPPCQIYQIPQLDKANSINKIQYRRFKPIIFGQSWSYKNYWGFYKKSVSHKWQLNRYPATIFGSMGSSKPDTYRTVLQKWIANKEGCILLNADIDTELNYNFILNVAKENGFLENVYVLKAYEDYFHGYNEEARKENLEPTHSIDPINPLIGNVWAFKQLFGEHFGEVVHAICQEIKNRGCLVDNPSLLSMLSWKNLNDWSENKTWGEANYLVENYLLSTRSPENHAESCVMAFRTIKTLKKYTQTGLFSIQPDIRLIDIFRKRQILAILLSSRISGYMEERTMNIIMAINIHHTASEMDKNNTEGNHWQNIMMTEPEDIFSKDNWINPNLIKEYFATLSSSSNWVFGGYSPDSDKPAMNEAIKVSQSVFMMKTESSAEQLPEGLRLKILSKVTDTERLLTDTTVYAHLPKEQQPYQIHDLWPGYGYFFTQGKNTNNKNKNNEDYVNHDDKQYYFKRVHSDYYSYMKHQHRLYKKYHNGQVLPKVPSEHWQNLIIQ